MLPSLAGPILSETFTALKDVQDLGMVSTAKLP